MGTCSYVLTGTDQGMEDTFGTTCHGAVSKLFNLLVINVGRFFFGGGVVTTLKYLLK